LVKVHDEGACEKCKVQKEYERMWNAIRDETLEGLAKVEKTNRLIITGISLGGALAELSFVDIQKSRMFENVQVITWGAPRVGNIEWVEWFNIHTKSQRFFIQQDPIPDFPHCLFGLCRYAQTLYGISCNYKKGWKKTDTCVCKYEDKKPVNPVVAMKTLAEMTKEHFVEEGNDSFEGILDHINGYKTLYNCELIE